MIYQPKTKVMRKLNQTLFLLAFLFSGTLFAQTITTGFTFDGQARTYILHIPPGFTANDTLPLVLNLHGLTQSGQAQRAMSGFDTISDRERFIVVHPDGINASWNTTSNPSYYSGINDVGFLSALIDTINRDYHINLNRVYSTGMSNGGFMSYRLACELSHRIAAIASVTGCMTDSIRYYCNPTRPMPVMHFHGTSDPIVNYNGNAANNLSVDASLQYWIDFNGCPGNFSTTPFPDIVPSDNTTISRLHWAPCNNQTEVIHYKVQDGGHTWAGAQENFIIGGNRNYDVNASEIIWEFFNRHSLDGTINSVKEVESENSITLYPNPANHMLNVEWKDIKAHSISITDISGRNVLSVSAVHTFSSTINTEKLESGIYFLNLNHDKGSVAKRFVKE
jgi:polyhydroxybutyrate depolymerase